MKIGDLVKYKDKAQGLFDFLGIVVYIDDYGEAPVVFWNRGRGEYTELPEFIEVLSESR